MFVDILNGRCFSSHSVDVFLFAIDVEGSILAVKMVLWQWNVRLQQVLPLLPFFISWLLPHSCTWSVLSLWLPVLLHDYARFINILAFRNWFNTFIISFSYFVIPLGRLLDSLCKVCIFLRLM